MFVGESPPGTTVVNHPSPQMPNQSTWKIAVSSESQLWEFSASIPELPISDVSSKGGTSAISHPTPHADYKKPVHNPT